MKLIWSTALVALTLSITASIALAEKTCNVSHPGPGKTVSCDADCACVTY